MSYRLHPAAQDEFSAAAAYYAEHASRFVAAAFIKEFERVMLQLERNQQLGTVVAGGLRTHRFQRFPYSVVFREAQAGPIVYAVSHHRRRPGYWTPRT